MPGVHTRSSPTRGSERLLSLLIAATLVGLMLVFHVVQHAPTLNCESSDFGRQLEQAAAYERTATWPHAIAFVLIALATARHLVIRRRTSTTPHGDASGLSTKAVLAAVIGYALLVPATLLSPDAIVGLGLLALLLVAALPRRIDHRAQLAALVTLTVLLPAHYVFVATAAERYLCMS